MVQLSLLIPIGACIHCWHPPAAHKDAGDRAVTSGGEIPAEEQTAALGAEGTVSCEVPSFKCEPDIAGVGASEQEPNVQEAPQSPPNVARANSQPSLAAGTTGDTRMSEMWSKDNMVPPFSDAIQPLLHGQSMSRDEQNRLARQLRHELIDFLNNNNLIEDSNPAIRRWKYQRLGESLVSAYPKILWDKPGRGTKCSTKSPMATFLSRLAETRRHRKARGDKKTELPRLSPVPSDSREQCAPTIDMTRAIQELKELAAAVNPSGQFGFDRMKQLLGST
uniref:Uncharacterized protein n=1 Tax=Ixodes ricinus TaxID=34613 RepID=A0A147BGR2_IXORI